MTYKYETNINANSETIPSNGEIITWCRYEFKSDRDNIETLYCKLIWIRKVYVIPYFERTRFKHYVFNCIVVFEYDPFACECE